MSEYNTFLVYVYSEESFSFTESEYNEAMCLMNQDSLEGYSDWSESLEQAEWEAEQERRSIVETEAGRLMIKRECAHRDCGFNCSRGQKYMGIAI